MAQLKYPCPENPDSFSDANGKPYCETCSRTLIDFTGMSNTEVKEAIENNPDGCGVFREDQVNRKNTNELRSLFRIAFAMVFVFGLSTSAIFGQSCGPKEMGFYSDDRSVDVRVNEKAKTRLFGKVSTWSGKAIKNATLTIYNGENVYVVYTDKNGQFELDPTNRLNAQEVEITVKARKRTTKHLTIERINGATEINIKLSAKHKRRQRYPRYVGKF